jgi:hypothetical protein
VVIEASVAAGYLIAWAVRKARRVAGRLDAETDAAIDSGLDRLHDVVAAKLSGHPVLAELVEEAAADGQVSDLTLQQMELAIRAAASKDEAFGRAVNEQVTLLRGAESASGTSVVIFGDVRPKADNRGIAIGLANEVHFHGEQPGPPQPDPP